MSILIIMVYSSFFVGNSLGLLFLLDHHVDDDQWLSLLINWLPLFFVLLLLPFIVVQIIEKLKELAFIRGYTVYLHDLTYRKLRRLI